MSSGEFIVRSISPCFVQCIFNKFPHAFTWQRYEIYSKNLVVPKNICIFARSNNSLTNTVFEMRKLLLSVCGLIAAFNATAQTPQFVSTEPSNRNVIIEEFTGVNCGYCPGGHRIVREYEEANPGRVFGINIHQGGYAAMYTTQWGDSIANQTGLNSYPSGTVNRHRFGGTATALGRDRFVNAGNQIQAMSSFVNVAAQATIDAATRTLTVNVEAYYTADAETGMNLINVALLQDSIIGPQSGASANPSQVTSDGKYIHMHMLRHLLTGQWGDTVSVEEGVIPQGTLVQRTYTCDLPSYMSDANVKLNHLNVVVESSSLYTVVLSPIL